MAWPYVFDIDAATLDPSAFRPRSERPTLMLVHEAFHTPAHLNKLTEELRAMSLKVLCPQLPSSMDAQEPQGLESDAAALFDCARSEIETSTNVVVVMFGYGAIPGVVAAQRLNQHSLDVPYAGEVTKLVYVSGMVLQQAESFMTTLRPPWVMPADDDTCSVSMPGQIFYQDCSLESAREAAECLRPQSMSSLQSVASDTGQPDVPSLYILCELDRAIPAGIQRGFVRVLQEQKEQADVMSLQTGHSPFLSRPRETARIITNFSLA
ncbi:hypothetical protein BAUCODRAFT_173198 [Baudoinia panamericana UAMH 10762]|uniref:AB hydrolase-1 domain-containing protein n=1 Tax=Baudoinia panamericana (strain UAMH 10762) TaxID=717646 RepID=M2MUF0_BAUPA|nr:uncharacterized protein BAUCODRAFT_173198 [Baudoinia panamericana UAMH 10762]EMD00542.1 hypothetical protein BAUCODRAFT_173198 [Baudoinia panamericana UAMH 10762]